MVGSLVDARPPNCLFDTPRFVHTGGDSLARMQVAPEHDLEVAKADLKNYYHSCEAPQPLRRFFGLRRVRASHLRAAGLVVPRSCVDARGYCWPRLRTIPMGFSPAPGLSQGGHESILYGEKGEGSAKARSRGTMVFRECAGARQRSGRVAPRVGGGRPHARPPKEAKSATTAEGSGYDGAGCRGRSLRK